VEPFGLVWFGLVWFLKDYWHPSLDGIALTATEKE
jgi:hypothetical protein